MPIRRTINVSACFAAIGLAVVTSTEPSFAAQAGEAARVIAEACGDEPEPACVGKLQKACRGKVTFRCYYARKRRIDGPDSPERSGEREDRSIFYDE